MGYWSCLATSTACCCDELLHCFLFVVEDLIQHRKAEEIKHVVNLWRHPDKLYVAVVVARIFDECHEHSKTRARDIREVAEVHDDLVALIVEQLLERLLELWCRVRVEVAVEINDLRWRGFSYRCCKLIHINSMS